MSYSCTQLDSMHCDPGTTTRPEQQATPHLTYMLALDLSIKQLGVDSRLLNQDQSKDLFHPRKSMESPIT